MASKARAEHTLSDMLKLKMSWFYDVNNSPEQEKSIDYIKSMVQSNTFKGWFPIKEIFPDYKVPTDIGLVNKAYFEYYEIKSKSGVVPKLNDKEIELLMTPDLKPYEQSILDKQRSIQDYSAVVGERQRHIKDYIQEIASSHQKIDEKFAEIEGLKVRMAAMQADGECPIAKKFLEDLDDTDFSLVHVGHTYDGKKKLWIMSRNAIFCTYYKDDKRIEVPFGHILVSAAFTDTWAVERVYFTKDYRGHSSNLALHPHVSRDGSLCAGDVSHIVLNPAAETKKRLVAMMGLLTTYNPRNPFNDISVFVAAANSVKPQTQDLPALLVQKLVGLDLYDAHEIRKLNIPKFIIECRNNRYITAFGIFPELVDDNNREEMDRMHTRVKIKNIMEYWSVSGNYTVDMKEVQFVTKYMYMINWGNDGHSFGGVRTFIVNYFDDKGIRLASYRSGRSPERGDYVPFAIQSSNNSWFAPPEIVYTEEELALFHQTLLDAVVEYRRENGFDIAILDELANLEKTPIWAGTIATIPATQPINYSNYVLQSEIAQPPEELGDDEDDFLDTPNEEDDDEDYDDDEYDHDDEYRDGYDDL